MARARVGAATPCHTRHAVERQIARSGSVMGVGSGFDRMPGCDAGPPEDAPQLKRVAQACQSGHHVCIAERVEIPTPKAAIVLMTIVRGLVAAVVFVVGLYVIYAFGGG